MDDADWDDVEASVVSDGGRLPDGEAEGVGLQGWQALLDLIRSRSWRSEFRQGDDSLPIPERASELFEPAPGGTLATWITPRIQINVFANARDSIYFDFDTTEISGGGLRAIGAFVRDLGQAVRTPVRLSHEGAASAVFLTYDPATDSFKAPG